MAPATQSKHHLEVLSELPEQETGRPPLLFVHGLGHGAWCWEKWLPAAAAAGFPSYALSLRGHAGSGGSLRTSRLSDYVDDVIAVAESLPGAPVLVGHSMGGLVVQHTLARYQARAGVLVASVGHRPAIGSLGLIARHHPMDAAAVLVGRSLPMRPDYMFLGLSDAEAEPHVARCGPESPLAQYQLLLHRPAGAPLGGVPMLALGAPEDRLVPIADVRATAARYGAELREFPGIGHDLMLDRGWEAPLDALLAWVAELAG